MNQNWSRLRQLFEEAVDLAPDERRAFLDAECGDDADLRQAVEQLLVADLEAGEFLDDPLVRRRGDKTLGMSDPPSSSSLGSNSGSTPNASPAAGLSASLSASLSGAPRPGTSAPQDPTAVGPYRILRKLGQGGMGEVFLAVREDEFQRRVVVKVVRPDLENPDLLRRLRAERQILAGLDHPHIAHLYDGGSTDDGRPYFVMEYVEGVPIVRYCDENQLSVDERVTLFRKVCSAVQYAHQNLVVHRDLKPSNILVTADGEPKLLDFGIAKLLNPAAGPEHLDVTATWQRILTPQYASPEQVRGKLVTTASDVYSLGVLLFELLTGRYPFHFARRSPREIERILSDEEPPRPSAVVLTDAPPTGGTTTAAAELAKLRGAPPRELGRRLAGDLDSIVLKALRAAPHRRYSSVEALAADLERFQQGLPVTARRGTASYRLSRFLARHRLAAAATAAVAFLLVFVAVTSYRQSQRLAAERDRALLEQSRKETVMALMLDVLSVADPYSENGGDLTVREALESSRQPLQKRLKDEPALRAELLHTTGVVLRNLGLWTEAKEDLEEAVRLRRGLYGEDHLDVAESESALAHVLAELGDDGAPDLALAAHETVEAKPDASVSRRLDAVNTLVTTYCIVEEYETAEPYAEQALELARQAPERDLDALALALYNRGSVYLNTGENTRAAEFYRQALALDEQLRGDDHLVLATSWNNLGSALRRSGDDKGAEQAFRRSLEITAHHLGDDHPELAAMRNNLAMVLANRGLHAEAVEQLRQARSSFISEAGGEHPRILFLDLRIAASRLAQSEEEARAVDRELRAARPVWAQRLGDDHPLVHRIDLFRAEALMKQGLDSEAEPLVASFIEAMREAGRDSDLEAGVEVMRELFARLYPGDTFDVERVGVVTAAE